MTAASAPFSSQALVTCSQSRTFSPVTWLTPSFTLPMLPAPSVFVNCHSPSVLRLRAPCTAVCDDVPSPAAEELGAVRREALRDVCPSDPGTLRPSAEMLACREGGCEPLSAREEVRRLASRANDEEGAVPVEGDRAAEKPFVAAAADPAVADEAR